MHTPSRATTRNLALLGLLWAQGFTAPGGPGADRKPPCILAVNLGESAPR